MWLLPKPPGVLGVLGPSTGLLTMASAAVIPKRRHWVSWSPRARFLSRWSRDTASTRAETPPVGRAVVSDKPLPVLVKPLSFAALGDDARRFFSPQAQNAVYRNRDFTVILKPFPRDLTHFDGTVDASKLVPPWLPRAVSPATHERRHLRHTPFPLPSTPTPLALLNAEEAESFGSPGEDNGDLDVDHESVMLRKWDPVARSAAEIEAIMARQRPILRVLVLSTKKRIHKLAVIRNRVRTRVVTALRIALHRAQEQSKDPSHIPSVLQNDRNAIMIMPNSSAHARDMDALVAEMAKAVAFLCTAQLRKDRSASASEFSGSRTPQARTRFANSHSNRSKPIDQRDRFADEPSWAQAKTLRFHRRSSPSPSPSSPDQFDSEPRFQYKSSDARQSRPSNRPSPRPQPRQKSDKANPNLFARKPIIKQ
ncbi:hypothetical protein BCV70DRAFT_108183 [Testicularia cyperi]|uniref:Uncharacterized protein n=1 Tax=Testicularia cyperi TaxID=1882483 RepID=A0A317XR76_9BASI|nr:hypothetical protein BCV70DRAFT_108183 [Testicularia cyperi]